MSVSFPKWASKLGCLSFQECCLFENTLPNSHYDIRSLFSLVGHFFSYYYLFETRSGCVAHSGLEPMGSINHPASAFQWTVGMATTPRHFFFKENNYIMDKVTNVYRCVIRMGFSSYFFLGKIICIFLSFGLGKLKASYMRSFRWREISGISRVGIVIDPKKYTLKLTGFFQRQMLVPWKTEVLMEDWCFENHALP